MTTSKQLLDKLESSKPIAVTLAGNNKFTVSTSTLSTTVSAEKPVDYLFQ